MVTKVISIGTTHRSLPNHAIWEGLGPTATALVSITVSICLIPSKLPPMVQAHCLTRLICIGAPWIDGNKIVAPGTDCTGNIVFYERPMSNDMAK